jgi:signal transduction histidine kinase
MTRGLRVVVFPACLALGLYAEWAALRRGPLEEAASSGDLRLAVGDLAVGLVLVGCGLVAWTRRPESRIGLLLTLSGTTWFLGTFAASGDSAYADFGAVFVTLHRGPLVHALLSYPRGRVEGWVERVSVALAYVVSAIPDVGGSTAGEIVLASVVLAVGARRLVSAEGPQRRARMPAAACSASFAGVLVVAAVADLTDASASLDRGVLWAYMVVVAAVAVALAVDLVLRRWVWATVTGLVVDLGEAAKTGTLRDRLARALGDRSLVLGYRLADRDVYVDDRGRHVELPGDDGDRRVTVVRDGDEPVAVLVHDAGVLADSELVESVVAAARIAVVNARLQAEVLRQVDELAASRRRLLAAADAERNRLELQLRDGAERRLVLIRDLLAEARSLGNAEVAAVLAETEARLEDVWSEVREFARGIHPRALSEGGLATALRELAERSTVPVDLSVPALRFAPPVESAAYFVCSEGLSNLGKHANASRATMRVAQRDGVLVVSVGDDGRGGAHMEAGSGLLGLADRVEALGGRLTVTSPPGEGTLLAAELPLV